MSEPDWLSEQIKTCKNLCLVAELLIEQERRELLPTVCELLFVEAQTINDDYCVVKLNENT